MIGAAFGLGFTFGPMIGGIMSRVSYAAPFYVAAAMAAANVALLYFILPESLPARHRAQPHEEASVVEVFQHGSGAMFAIVVATYFFLVIGFTIMTAFFALLTERRFGYDAHANGYLFGFIGIITVIVQGGLIGRLVRIFGETLLARVGLLLTAASLVLLPHCTSLTWLLIVCVGFSFGSGFASPPLNGLASQMIDRSWQGRALGVLQSAGSTARLIGPLLGGWLLMMDLHKPIARYGETPFYAAAFLCVIGAVLAFCLRKPAADRIPETIPVGSSV
jgi:MFS family permease